MNKKIEFLSLGLVLVFTFLLVFSPHFDYPFPFHIDEWHHITESIKLGQGEYSEGTFGYRIGFQAFLLLLDKILNLVLFYKFLPAIWAVFSALVLFYVVYTAANRQFLTALFAVIFFSSIKSNVNITGLWFFTPLSFSIPFIFLYVHFFNQGIKKENKKLILISLLIMAGLLFFHPISVLFSFLILLIFSLFHIEYFKKEWKFFSLFLIIPVLGFFFYKIISSGSLASLAKELQFKKGWGVLEISNSPFELYSLTGYVLAFIGLVVILKSKKHLIYVLWPIAVLASIIFYKLAGVSYLSPYQRNLYYFVISLPFLSAFGFSWLMNKIRDDFLRPFIFIIVIFLTFVSYYNIPSQIDLYRAIDNNDYTALLYLSSFEKSTVMAIPSVSEAIYPISGHNPAATFFFYGNRNDVDEFFQTDNCEKKKEILDKYKAGYVLLKSEIFCNWDLIYDEGDYIYKI